MNSTQGSIGRFHLGVWVAGAIGFVVFLGWSFSLGLFISSQVGRYNDFWEGGHLVFTMIAALPLAIGGALTWGCRLVGMPLRRLMFAFAAFLMALILFLITMRPGLELWFLIADFFVLSLGPVFAFSSVAAAWHVTQTHPNLDEPCDAPKSRSRAF